MALESYTLEQAEEDIANLRGQVDQMLEIIRMQDSAADIAVTVTGGAWPYSLAGQLKYGSTDGSNYDTGRLITPYTGAGQLVNLTTPVVLGTCTAPLAVGTYNVFGRVKGLNGATSAAQALRLVSTGGLVASSVDIDYLSSNYGALSGTISNFANLTALNTDLTTGAVVMTNGFTFSINFWGTVVVGTAGTLNLEVRCVTAAADTWTAEAISYLGVQPITG
jgi:hypothetical protein